MREFTDEDRARWVSMIGHQVWKNPKTSSTGQPKPFKSGRKINTVTGIVTHEQTGRLGFTFLEDATVVECWRCSLAPEEPKLHDAGPRGARANWTRLEAETAEIRRLLQEKAATPDSERQPQLHEGVIFRALTALRITHQ